MSNGSGIFKMLIEKYPGLVIVLLALGGPAAGGVTGYFGSNQAVNDRLAKLERNVAVIEERVSVNKESVRKTSEIIQQFYNEGRMQTPAEKKDLVRPEIEELKKELEEIKLLIKSMK